MDKKTNLVFTALIVSSLVLSGCGIRGAFFPKEVWSEGTYFLIDEQGNKISDRTYLDAGIYQYDIKSNYMLVQVENKEDKDSDQYKKLYGAVDKSGEFVVEPCYEGLPRLTEDGIFHDDSFESWSNIYFDDEGHVLELKNEDRELGQFAENGLASIRHEMKYGFIDKNYNFIIEAQFEEAKDFTDSGLAAVKNSEDLWGYINASGEYVIPARYLDAYGFNEGYAAVEVEYGKWGYIDESGTLVTSADYDAASYFQEGFTTVQKGNQYYLMDVKENIVAPVRYATSYTNGLAIDVDESGKLGMLDTNGELVIPYEYSVLFGADDVGNIVAERNGSYGIIDRNNNIVVPFEYSSIGEIDDCDIYWVKDESDLYGFIDKEGKVIVPCQYKSVSGFSANGMALVKTQDDLYGYINTDGSYRIEPQYKDAYPFNSKIGLAAVSLE